MATWKQSQHICRWGCCSAKRNPGWQERQKYLQKKCICWIYWACRDRSAWKCKSRMSLWIFVEAEKSVILTGKKGMLIGGYTHATESFEAITVGNDAEVKTVIHVGSKPELIEKKKVTHAVRTISKKNWRTQERTLSVEKIDARTGCGDTAGRNPKKVMSKRKSDTARNL